MNQKNTLLAATLLGASAVGLGAFGAHAFKAMLLANGRLDTYELAVRYQFYHTLAMMGAGVLIERYPGMKTGTWLMLAGILIFSGSLYVLALANEPILGAVTPLGGVLLILGWLSFTREIYKGQK